MTGGGEPECRPINLIERSLATSHGTVAVVDSGATAQALLLIHGNSMCWQAFAGQFDSPLAARYRMIAFDLPGHGASADARDPERSYSIPAYAELAQEVLDALGVNAGAALGWSLGGHVGLELMARWRGLCGLMIVGTPPVSPGPDALSEAFLASPLMAFAGQRDAAPAEADAYARACCGPAIERMSAVRAMARRTDGRARWYMMRHAMAGLGIDARRIAETSPIPLAVVIGDDDPFVSRRYLLSLRYAGLWRDAVQVMEGCGHAPFLDRPREFNALLASFLADAMH